MENIVGIIGFGFVGSAIYESLSSKNCKIYKYDKYKELDSRDDVIKANIIFLSLPTVYDEGKQQYDLKPIEENLEYLSNVKYSGMIINKSTVLPGTSENLSKKYSLNIIHNPEFLTARTAAFDFHNQTHIVLGKTSNCCDRKYNNIVTFYKTLYPNAEISKCNSTESECMKIFCNSFYSVKIQFFNELYLLSKKLGTSYDNIKNLMLKNNWINPMHTNVPGPDGLLSYGGLCFPKDTHALLEFMKTNSTAHKVLEATINERNIMRQDKDNIV